MQRYCLLPPEHSKFRFLLPNRDSKHSNYSLVPSPRAKSQRKYWLGWYIAAERSPPPFPQRNIPPNITRKNATDQLITVQWQFGSQKRRKWEKRTIIIPMKIFFKKRRRRKVEASHPSPPPAEHGNQLKYSPCGCLFGRSKEMKKN